jgi:type IV pilus assembly protein PilM
VSSKAQTQGGGHRVSGHSVIIKKISMPRMSQEELEEAIQWEAEQHIPFDINDVNIDVQILNTDANDQTGQMDVLLVAAKKDMINDYTQVVTRSRASRRWWSTSTPSPSRTLLEINYEVPRSETVVLINAGAAVVNINILARRRHHLHPRRDHRRRPVHRRGPKGS